MPEFATPLPPFDPDRFWPGAHRCGSGEDVLEPLPAARVTTQSLEGVSQAAEEPEAKRQKKTGELEPEGVWLKAHARPIGITVQIAQVKAQKAAKYALNGQTLVVADLLLSMTVREVKEKLQALLNNLPPTNQKLSTANLGVLQDSCTLAFYNFADNEILALGFKDRGGGK